MARSLAHFFDNASFDFEGVHKVIVAPEGDGHGPITIPDAHLLFSGEFNRSGSDLIIHADHGDSVVVAGYFRGEETPALRSPDGAILDAKVVQLLAGSANPGAYAQAGGTPAPDQAAIGKVEQASGSVTITHADGVVVPAKVGDLVHKGDVVQTGGHSSVGIGFADGTAFSLSADARMVLNEFVFDPNGSSNKALISLVQGTFGFLAGKVAKTGDMKVDTPVATMGIRGTAVYSHVNLVDGTTEYSVGVEEDGVTVGSFVLISKKDGVSILDTVNDADIMTRLTPRGGDVEIEHFRKSSGDVQSLTALLQGAFSVHHLYENNPIGTPHSNAGDHGSGDDPHLLLTPPPPFNFHPLSFPNNGPAPPVVPDHLENAGINNGLVPPILFDIKQNTAPPLPTLSVTISGTPQGGQTLTATPTLSTGQTSSVDYQWQFFDLNSSTWKNIPGATQALYTLTEGDEGKLIRVETTYSAQGQTLIADSAPTTQVADEPTTLAVTITGTAQQGQTLTATPTFTGEAQEGPITYQWQFFDPISNSWKNIAGATHALYTLTESDEFKQIRVEATYSAEGQTLVVDSAPTSQVTEVPSTLTVAISGTAQEGQTLTATAMLVSDGQAAPINYQWQYYDRSTHTWKDIAGATHARYTVTEGDEGKQIRVEATYSAEGQNLVADSAPTSNVIDLNPILAVSETSGHQRNVDFVLAGLNSAVALNILALDPDGGAVSALISGLPADVTLSDSHGDHLQIENGSILLTASELAGLTLHTGHTGELISLTVTAENIVEGGSSAPKTLAIDVSGHIAEWKQGSGDWSDGFNWTGVGHCGPSGNNDVLVDASGTSKVEIDGHAVANSLTISAANATVEVGSHGALSLTQALTVVAGSFELNGGSVTAASVSIEAGGKLFGHGTVTGSVDNSGTVESKDGTLEIKGDVGGLGALKIESNSTLQLDGADGNNVTFLNNSGNSGTLVLKDSFDFSGKVFGFTGHDSIDLKDVNYNSGDFTASYSHGALTVSDGVHKAQIAFNGNYTIASFDFSSDSHNGTFIIDPPASANANAGHSNGPAQSVVFDQSGHETFVFQPGFGVATVTNFSASGASASKLELDSFANVPDFAHLQPLLQATNGGHDTSVNLGHGDNITLVNVPVNGLQSSDFIIHHA